MTEKSEPIDEIIRKNVDVHFEMMDDDYAVLIIGEERFVLSSGRSQLVVKEMK